LKTIKTYLPFIASGIIFILCIVNYESIFNVIIQIIDAFSSLFFGVVISFVLKRPYIWFQKMIKKIFKINSRLNKYLSILCVYISLFGLSILIITSIVPQFIDNIYTFLTNLDQYEKSLQLILDNLTTYIHMDPIDLESITYFISKLFDSETHNFQSVFLSTIQSFENGILIIKDIFISIVFSIYIMADMDNLSNQCKSLFKTYIPKQYFESIKYVIYTVIKVFDDYVAGQTLEAIILGTLCFIGMLILQINYAGIISVVIAITALIPVLGAYVGGGIAVLLLLFTEPNDAIIFLIFLIVLQQIEGNLIYPRVVGQKIGLPGIWVFASVIIGGELCGIIGILIAVPITTIIYKFIKRNIEENKNVNLLE